jgi:hypothetical membrane protein
VRRRLGAISWLTAVAYFAVQPVVAAAWDPAYSFLHNTISALGNARCDPLLCSPRHPLMNVVFVIVGLGKLAGAVLNHDHWPPRRLATTGLVLVALGGAGGVLVGLAPADTNQALHLVGAGLQFPAAVGPLLLGLATPRVRPAERSFSLVMGAVGIVGCALFAGGLRVGVGVGGTERLGFDPCTVWTAVLGGVLLLRAGRERGGRLNR